MTSVVVASLLGSCAPDPGGDSADAGPDAAGGTGGSNGRVGTGGAPGLGGADTGSGGAGGNGAAGGRGVGGATGGGGSAAGVGGASGLGGAGACVPPVNPNATAQARNLLCYLYSQSGNHVLSGQQETSWASNPEVDMNYLNTNTGKYPAIRGGDYLYPNGTSTRAIAWWNAGGIPMLCYHMGAPTLADTFQSSQTAVPGGINAVLTPGTAQYTSFIQRLDYAAAELQKLQTANVAVLWRPFHEAGGTWFWWSKEGGAQYVRLWNFMFDYFTNTKHLNNLVWLHPFDGTPPAAFFPGKAVVDVGGSDTYASNTPFASLFDSTRTIVGTTLPISLHENGLMPDPAIMFGATKTPWVMFNTWADTFLTVTNSLSYVKTVYANSAVVTRDELPSLK